MAINRTLIEGQRLMREAGKDQRGKALMEGLSTQLAAGIAERKAITATADKYMDELGGIENMNLIEPSQKGAVTDFLRTKRDEFSDLANQYAENPSSEIKDKMDAIKFQFSTVNNQLKSYMDKRKEYLSDRDEGNLQTGGSFDKDNTFFESTYGNPDSAFAIDYETGKISFTGAGNETRSLEDFGDHTLRNYEGEASASTVFADAKKIKYDGGMFDKGRVSQQFVFKHKAQGADEIQSLIQTDLSGDNSDLGFMQQWASGNLKDKSLYEGFEANKDGTYDASWMLENSNKQQVLDSMGKFVGNVSENIYNASDENPERVRRRNQQNQQNNKQTGSNIFTDAKPVVINGRTVGNISASARELTRKSVLGEKDFTGYHGYYEWDQTEGKYKVIGQNSIFEEDSFQTKYDILDTEGGRIDADVRNNVNQKTILVAGSDVVYKEGEWKQLIVNGDDATAKNLNVKFNLNNNSEILFIPYESAGDYDDRPAEAQSLFFKDDLFSKDVMAVNPLTKQTYKDNNGKPIRIKSRNSKGWNAAAADQELIEIYKLVEKAGEYSTPVQGTKSSTDPLN